MIRLPYYQAFKEDKYGKPVWLSRRERIIIWIGDCLSDIGWWFLSRADQAWESVNRGGLKKF